MSWKHHCDNLSCTENSGGNCLVYSIWYKGKPQPKIENCSNYEEPKLDIETFTWSDKLYKEK